MPRTKSYINLNKTISSHTFHVTTVLSPIIKSYKYLLKSTASSLNIS